MTVKSANKKKIQLLSPGAAARGARSPAPLPRPANRQLYISDQESEEISQTVMNEAYTSFKQRNKSIDHVAKGSAVRLKKDLE